MGGARKAVECGKGGRRCGAGVQLYKTTSGNVRKKDEKKGSEVIPSEFWSVGRGIAVRTGHFEVFDAVAHRLEAEALKLEQRRAVPVVGHHGLQVTLDVLQGGVTTVGLRQPPSASKEWTKKRAPQYQRPPRRESQLRDESGS